jgi:hypothetical protein
MLALMLVPAVVALVSTSLLLYVLLLDKHPELFASNDPETPQAVEEQKVKPTSRWQVVPRYGFAASGQEEAAAIPPPQSQPVAEPQTFPETATISIGNPQSIVQQFAQPAPARPSPQAEPSPLPAQETPPAVAAVPQAGATAVTVQSSAESPGQAVAPVAAVAAAPIQPVPPEVLAEWGDPGLQPAQAGAPVVPPDRVLLLLIRSSLLALHRSNITGDYEFLRGVSSIPFQNANPPGKLSQIFANLRDRGVDLSPAMFVQPKLIAKPEINQRDVLRISGFFPTEPERIYFDLKFLRGPQGRWRLFGITAEKLAPKPKAQTAATPAAAAAQQAPSQLAPTGAEANPAPAAGPAAAPQDTLPPLPSRKPAISLATPRPAPEGEGAVEGYEEAKAGTTIEDVHDRVDEADAQPAEKKKGFWPFRRRDSEE